MRRASDLTLDATIVPKPLGVFARAQPSIPINSHRMTFDQSLMHINIALSFSEYIICGGERNKCKQGRPAWDEPPTIDGDIAAGVVRRNSPRRDEMVSEL